MCGKRKAHKDNLIGPKRYRHPSGVLLPNQTSGLVPKLADGQQKVPHGNRKLYRRECEAHKSHDKG
jgi:hypothetical protein